jgi:hypothetical protein
MVDRMIKPDYDERFRDTLERLLPETYNLMSAQAALEVLMDHQSGVILAQSFSALMGDRLARLIRIFENSDDTATFWYLHRCEPVNVAKDVDIPRLEACADPRNPELASIRPSSAATRPAFARTHHFSLSHGA